MIFAKTFIMDKKESMIRIQFSTKGDKPIPNIDVFLIRLTNASMNMKKNINMKAMRKRSSRLWCS